MDIKEIKGWSQRVSRGGLKFDLLGEHFAIQGDTAAEGHGSKMGTPRALLLRPSSYGGEDFSEALVQKIQERIIGRDDVQAGTIFRAVRTKLENLYDACVVAARGANLNSGNVPYIFSDGSVQGRRCE